jgi:hypothetical protein
MYQTGYWIVVDNLPLGTHYSGDSFIVSGETNLPVGQEIDFGAALQGFRVGAPDINPPYYTGSTIVTEGSENVHTWSFVINTSRFQKGQEGYRNGVIQAEAIPGDYDLIIGPFNQNLYFFTLVNRTGPIEINPAHIIPASTSACSMSQQTTPSILIPILLPIIAIGIVMGMGNFRRKF